MMTLRQEAHACRIYGVAKEFEWDVTMIEISRILGMDKALVRKIVALKGWRSRLTNGRKVKEKPTYSDHVPALDEMIGG